MDWTGDGIKQMLQLWFGHVSVAMKYESNKYKSNHHVDILYLGHVGCYCSTKAHGDK